MNGGTANRVAPVSNIPTKISGTFSSDYQIVNVGTATIYLGQGSSVSTINYGVPLTPGGALQWSGDSELWAVTEPGSTGSLSILYSASSIFTPGPSRVTTEAANAPVLLHSQVVNLNNGSSSGNMTIEDLDITGYSCVRILIDVGRVVPGPVRAPDARDNTVMVVNQKATDQSVMDQTVAQFLICNDGNNLSNKPSANTSFLELPVNGQLLSTFITVSVDPARPFSGEKIQVFIYASSKQATEKVYEHRNDVFAVNFDSTVSGNSFLSARATIGTTDTFIASRNGESTLTVSKANSAAIVIARLYECNAGALSATPTAQLTTNANTYNALTATNILPMRPMLARLSIITAAGDGYLALTQ